MLHLFAIAISVFEIALIPVVISRRKDVAPTFAWILFILLVPLVGAAGYLIFGHNRVERRAKRKFRSNERMADLFACRLPRRPVAVEDRIAEMSEEERAILSVAVAGSYFEPSIGNRTALFTDGDAAFKRMQDVMREATHHIHIEFFIFASDATGEEFSAILRRKAQEGLEVRMLLDGFGCLKLKQSFIRELREAGVRVEFYLPLRKWKRWWNWNLRNHRKLLVVDGKVGFAGGMNVADDYRGRNRHLGPWHDAHVEVEGLAVNQMQWAFAEDWFFATGEEISPQCYPDNEAMGEDMVQVVASGPDRDVEVMYEFFFTAITTARRNVWIMTPYFVPDGAIMLALLTAARRGIDVRLLVPWKSNHKLAQYAGRYYYEDLLEAGAKIYEYPNGMLHAKVMVVDGAWGTVGSANMDIRSFRLNFELNLIVFSRKFADKLVAVFSRDFKVSRRVELERFRARPLRGKFIEAVCRLLSPML